MGQWTMDDVVRYIKIIGGLPGHEALIVGLADGQVWIRTSTYRGAFAEISLLYTRFFFLRRF